MKYALITTTINVPHNLEAYVKDIAASGFEEKVMVVVAGDKKTPPEAEAFCAKLGSSCGTEIKYLSPEKQEKLYPQYSAFLGWNTIQRRNIALLFAYHNSADVIVTIDDDNFLTKRGYFDRHGIFDKAVPTPIVESSSGWYNNCLRLASSNYMGEFYPRGYSVEHRGEAYPERRLMGEIATVRAVVNAGLWIGDPDIDAVTRLAINPKVDNVIFKPFALAKGTYCPFNSQNTALHRDVLHAYCMLSGVGRYDDIVPSYFVKRIADHLGEGIRFGDPVVRQERNTHNIWGDLEQERVGMQLTDKLVGWLRETDLSGTSYAECLVELLTAFGTRRREDDALTPEQGLFIDNILLSYQAWRNAL